MLTIVDFEHLYELNRQYGKMTCGGRPCLHLDKEALEALKNQDIDYLAKRFIDSYTDQLSDPLNRHLRQENPTQSPLLTHCAWLLNKCLDQVPAFNQELVHRIEQSVLSTYFHTWFKERIGSVVLIPSFWSTYRSPEFWKHTTPLYHILTSEESNARNISAYAPKAIRRCEGEVLFKSGTCFLIESVDELIHLREIISKADHQLSQDCHMMYWQDDEDTDEPSASELGLI